MIVVGIDEVGRGCWAGPLVVGAVVLGKPITGLKDSKKLSKRRRKVLADIIHKESLAIGLGWVSSEEIDDIGLGGCLKLAMERAIGQIRIKYDEVVIDGNVNYLSDSFPSRAVIKADETLAVVSAASIIAKVARDEFMIQAAQNYRVYGFSKNVGYGTAEHATAIERYGVCQLHRRSFKPIIRFIDSR